MLKQTTIFNVSFHLRAIFQKSIENSMILPAALSGRFFFFDELVCSRVASFSAQCCCRERASFSAHFWTLVEELNMLTTIRTIGRGAESVVGCKPVFLRAIGR